MVQYGQFEIPNKIKVDDKTLSSTFAKFIAEPFERGFGHTVGNSLRRMMLSSLEAPAIVSVRIEGIQHEYMAVEGIIQDMTNIILNFKGALLRKQITDKMSRDNRILTSEIEVTQEDLDQNKGQKEIRLGDIIKDETFEVINPELLIFTVTSPMKRQVDLTVAFGRGYVPSDRIELANLLTDQIVIDAAFSPIRLVNYYVENTRVGQDTDYDRLIVEVTTDGRISPLEALSYAAQIGHKHFDVFTSVDIQTLVFEEAAEDDDSDRDELMEKLSLRINEIELSVRSTNCLSGANITTIAELVTNNEKKLLEFRNFGRKSLNEIKAKLTEMNLYLGMELSKFGITSDNAREKVNEFLEQKKLKREALAIEE